MTLAFTIRDKDLKILRERGFRYLRNMCKKGCNVEKDFKNQALWFLQLVVTLF